MSIRISEEFLIKNVWHIKNPAPLWDTFQNRKGQAWNSTVIMTPDDRPQNARGKGKRLQSGTQLSTSHRHAREHSNIYTPVV